MGGKRLDKSVGQYFSMNALSRGMLLSQYWLLFCCLSCSWMVLLARTMGYFTTPWYREQLCICIFPSQLESVLKTLISVSAWSWGLGVYAALASYFTENTLALYCDRARLAQRVVQALLEHELQPSGKERRSNDRSLVEQFTLKPKPCSSLVVRQWLWRIIALWSIPWPRPCSSPHSP